MDWEFLFGVGIAVIFGLLQFAAKTIPPALTWGGMAVGALLVVWSILPVKDQIPRGPAFLFVFGVACIVGAVAWYFAAPRPSEEKSMSGKEPAPIIINNAIGGKGGDAIASNGGIAYAAPGGNAVIGGQGVGGNGGPAIANGPNMLAGAGQGGSVGSDRYWPHPAKNGYETVQRAKGLPVDPFMRQFGRGGAVSGYEEKLAIVNELRDQYFKVNGRKPKSYFEDIGAVPLGYLNNALASIGVPWRVKIEDGDEYDFYIP